MAGSAKKPDFKIVTYRARSKKRVSVLSDPSLVELMKAMGRPLPGPSRLGGEASGASSGILLLPTGQILELFKTADHQETAYLFASLDVWMSYQAD